MDGLTVLAVEHRWMVFVKIDILSIV